MKRGHLTKAEKKQIRALTKKGVRQSEIARRLGITAPSVSKAQKQMGLPTRVPTPEAQILALFRQRVPGVEISKRLKCPANRVWAIAHKHGIHNGHARTPEA